MMNDDGRILNKEVLKKKWNRFFTGEAAMILLLWKILHYRLQLICWWDEKQLPSIIYLGTFDKNININHWVFMKRYKCPKEVKMLKRGLQFEKRIKEQPIIINLIYYCKNENISSCKKSNWFCHAISYSFGKYLYLFNTWTKQIVSLEEIQVSKAAVQIC